MIYLKTQFSALQLLSLLIANAVTAYDCSDKDLRLYVECMSLSKFVY